MFSKMGLKIKRKSPKFSPFFTNPKTIHFLNFWTLGFVLLHSLKNSYLYFYDHFHFFNFHLESHNGNSRILCLFTPFFGSNLGFLNFWISKLWYFFYKFCDSFKFLTFHIFTLLSPFQPLEFYFALFKIFFPS